VPKKRLESGGGFRRRKNLFIIFRFSLTFVFQYFKMSGKKKFFFKCLRDGPPGKVVQNNSENKGGGTNE